MKQINLHLGSQLYCVAEPCGRISKIAFVPERWEVKEIIVEVQTMPEQARVLPLNLVVAGRKNNLYLDVHQRELARFPAYREYEANLDSSDWPPRQPSLGDLPAAELQIWSLIAEVEGATLQTRPPTNEVNLSAFLREHPAHIHVRQGVSPGLEVIGPGMEVRFADEGVGRLLDVVVQPQNSTITHLIVRRDKKPSKRALIPTSQVNAVSESVIYLATPAN